MRLRGFCACMLCKSQSIQGRCTWHGSPFVIQASVCNFASRGCHRLLCAGLGAGQHSLLHGLPNIERFFAISQCSWADRLMHALQVPHFWDELAPPAAAETMVEA